MEHCKTSDRIRLSRCSVGFIVKSILSNFKNMYSTFSYVLSDYKIVLFLHVGLTEKTMLKTLKSLLKKINFIILTGTLSVNGYISLNHKGWKLTALTFYPCIFTASQSVIAII